MARREVLAGQKYQSIDATSVWEIRELVKDAEGITHARMTKVGDSTAIKMISVSALRDARLYKLMPGQEETV